MLCVLSSSKEYERSGVSGSTALLARDSSTSWFDDELGDGDGDGLGNGDGDEAIAFVQAHANANRLQSRMRTTAVIILCPPIRSFHTERFGPRVAKPFGGGRRRRGRVGAAAWCAAKVDVAPIAANETQRMSHD